MILTPYWANIVHIMLNGFMQGLGSALGTYVALRYFVKHIDEYVGKTSLLSITTAAKKARQKVRS